VNVIFKEWLPDQPALGNPGLTRAENVIPYNEVYKCYTTLTTGAAAALADDPRGAHPYATTAGGTAAGYSTYGLLVGTRDDLLRLSTNGLTFNSIRSATYSGATLSAVHMFWDFAQFNNVLIATDKIDLPQRYTIGAANASTLGSTMGTAPFAQQVGVINEFVMLGNLATTSGGVTGFHSVQWSGAGDENAWPTPNSATATAEQSGLQELPAEAGTVTAITSGDQFGLIFQRAAVTRATYVGPPVVFQFDRIDNGRGCFYPNSVVQVGGLTYFASGLGFFVTDGITIQPIGAGQVDKYFADLVTGQNPARAVWGAVDYDTKCVMWSVVGTHILHYNYEKKRWSVAVETTDILVNGIQRS
jgi:hypothetical protein